MQQSGEPFTNVRAEHFDHGRKTINFISVATSKSSIVCRLAMIFDMGRIGNACDSLDLIHELFDSIRLPTGAGEESSAT
jgi:hypothetical protein